MNRPARPTLLPRRPYGRQLAFVLGTMVWLGCAVAGRAQMAEAGAPGQPPRPGTMLQQTGFDQRLGESVPLDLAFRDESGAPVKLGQYFGKRPVILNLVYFRCPMLCGQSLISLTRSMRAMSENVGIDFDVVTVSFDAHETPAMAAAKKQTFLEYYGRARAGEGWHFLTGDQASIDALCESVGFRYVYNASNGQFAHAAGLVVLSPDGLITRYYLDVDYPPRELQKSLAGASTRTVASAVGQVLMLCYDYDPATGRYTLAIVRILQVLGVLTALLLGLYVAAMLWRERSARESRARLASRNTENEARVEARSEPAAVGSSAGDD